MNHPTRETTHMSARRNLTSRIRQWLDRAPDPYATTARPAANPTGDPVIEAAGETTVYPDRTDFLTNPATEGTDHVPHGVIKWVMRGEAQFRKFAALARREIAELSAGAYGRTDAADDQTLRRDELKDAWTTERNRAQHAHTVLDPLVLHHGIGDAIRYVATWFLLILGDVAAGTLVLVHAGEHPFYAAIMMAALGAAAVTTGLLGKDLRRRNLWLTRRDELPAEEADAALVTKVFSVTDTSWRHTLSVLIAAVSAAGCLALGTIMFRSAVDNPVAGIAFGLWAIAIGAASFWNAWAHLDPAHTTLATVDATAHAAHQAYTAAPTDAIEARAANLAGIAETLRARCDEAWAAWYTCIAAAAEYLRVNPAQAGHGTIGLSYLHQLRPTDEDIFDQLADDYQLPRYRATRGNLEAAPVPRDTDTDGDAGSVIDLTAILGQRQPAGDTAPADTNPDRTASSATDADGNPPIGDEFLDLDQPDEETGS
jgi:hypothetical protein